MLYCRSIISAPIAQDIYTLLALRVLQGVAVALVPIATRIARYSLLQIQWTTFEDVVHISTDQFTAALGQTKVTKGINWLRADLNTYELHVESDRGVGTEYIFS